MKKSTNFFAVSEFKYPHFDHMQSEIEQIDTIGSITDNCDFGMPLVIFNTYNLSSCYNYYEKMRQFERLPLQDETNLSQNEVPHYFKTVYIPDDKFLVMGGLERESSITSARCFLIDEKGKLSVTSDMQIGRQYMTVCTDYPLDKIYVIGGYNSEKGLLRSFETF